VQVSGGTSKGFCNSSEFCNFLSPSLTPLSYAFVSYSLIFEQDTYVIRTVPLPPPGRFLRMGSLDPALMLTTPPSVEFSCISLTIVAMNSDKARTVPQMVLKVYRSRGTFFLACLSPAGSHVRTEIKRIAQTVPLRFREIGSKTR